MKIQTGVCLSDEQQARVLQTLYHLGGRDDFPVRRIGNAVQYQRHLAILARRIANGHVENGLIGQ
jgi:hypothetical protein